MKAYIITTVVLNLIAVGSSLAREGDGPARFILTVAAGSIAAWGIYTLL